MFLWNPNTNSRPQQPEAAGIAATGGANYWNGGVNSDFITESGGVNPLKNKLYQTIRTTPGLNAPALAGILSTSLRTIQRYLKQLADEGKIEFKGATKNGGYYIK